MDHAPQSIETNHELQGDLLVVRCRGRFEPQALVAAFKECLRLAVETKAAKLLFDCREIVGVPTFTQRFEMGIKAAELFHSRGSSKPLAAAMLVKSDFLDPERFGQTVARNRGLMGMTTDSEEEALRFLQSENSSE